MDSTQVASNILDSSRLQLAAELLQRFERLLSESDRARYAELLSPYLTDTVNQYLYRIKGKEQVQEQLTHIGGIIYQLLDELRVNYAQEAFLPVVERFFAEKERWSSQKTVKNSPAAVCNPWMIWKPATGRKATGSTKGMSRM